MKVKKIKIVEGGKHLVLPNKEILFILFGSDKYGKSARSEGCSGGRKVLCGRVGLRTCRGHAV